MDKDKYMERLKRDRSEMEDRMIDGLYDDISIALILIRRLYKSQINKDDKLLAIIMELEAYKKDYGFMAFRA